MFHKEEDAHKIFAEVESARLAKTNVAFTDDFSQQASIDGSAIAGALIEDMEKSKMAHIERALHQARTNARTQVAARSDPVLKNIATMQGPPMLQPMPNGHFQS
jgi:hypothetical protein